MIQGEPNKLDVAEIGRRRPVWIALSDLWLDTELTDDDLRRIAETMRRSGYTIGELREIYLYEVAPVVFTNLLSVAGEWAGFNEEWLVDEVTKQAKNRNPIQRLLLWLGIGRRIMTFATEGHWEKLVEMLETDT